jgi:NADH-quinone oxidoreductase subunit J
MRLIGEETGAFPARRERMPKESGMYGDAIFFWVFSATLVGSALAVILARNPVHSVLFLILSFVAASGLFLLMGAEFLGMILIVVYVGAVAVLFLFVVMMLDVDFAELKQGFLQYLPIGALIALFVAVELGYVAIGWTRSPQAAEAAAPIGAIANTAALGRVLYTQYFYFFQAAGMILLTAMIGAIVLTLRHRVGVKRQDVSIQVARNPASAVEVRKVPSRVGI